MDVKCSFTISAEGGRLWNYVCRMAQTWRVYWWASVFIRVEKDFSICFARELLPRTLDDLNSSIENGFLKIDNDPQLRKTVCLSIPKYLQQCTSPEGSQVKHLKQTVLTLK